MRALSGNASATQSQPCCASTSAPSARRRRLSGPGAREGDRKRTGFILATPGASVANMPGLAGNKVGPADLSTERQLRKSSAPAARQSDIVHRVALTGSMIPYRWTIDGRTWADHKPLTGSQGQQVELDIVNRTQMAHPMHLHGIASRSSR
jgi:FtsP/CotA-like multicopper oxidase with cupredoxin domain